MPSHFTSSSNLCVGVDRAPNCSSVLTLIHLLRLRLPVRTSKNRGPWWGYPGEPTWGGFSWFLTGIPNHCFLLLFGSKQTSRNNPFEPQSAECGGWVGTAEDEWWKGSWQLTQVAALSATKPYGMLVALRQIFLDTPSDQKVTQICRFGVQFWRDLLQPRSSPELVARNWNKGKSIVRR